MIETLIIYNCSGTVTMALVSLSQKEYAYLSKTHGYFIGVDKMAGDQVEANWAIDCGLNLEPESFPENTPEEVKRYAGRFVNSILNYDEVDIGKADKLIKTGCF